MQLYIYAKYLKAATSQRS